MPQRGGGAEVAVLGDSAGGQEMDHAGEELERGAKLLRRAVARADGQARKVSIMQSRILLRGYAREGEMPPSLATHPQNQQQQQNQNQEQNQGRLHRRLDTPARAAHRGLLGYYALFRP